MRYKTSSFDPTVSDTFSAIAGVISRGRRGLVVALTTMMLVACAGTPPDQGTGAEAPTTVAPPVKPEATLTTRKPQPGATSAAPAKFREPRLNPDQAVYFTAASADISAEGLRTVRSFADRLNSNRRLIVTLIGSADNQGSKEMCVAIANKRTAAVEEELRGLGVKLQQIRKYARGCETVIDLACTSESCRKQYRRVDLSIENS